MEKNEYPERVRLKHYLHFDGGFDVYLPKDFIDDEDKGGCVEYRKMNDDEIIVKKSDIRENLFTPHKVFPIEDVIVCVYDDEAEEMIYSNDPRDDYFFEFVDGKLKAFYLNEVDATFEEPAHVESVEIEEPIMLASNPRKVGEGENEESFNEFVKGFHDTLDLMPPEKYATDVLARKIYKTYQLHRKEGK